LELLLDRRRDGVLIGGLKFREVRPLVDELCEGIGLIGWRLREVEM
jgi:hypothetical protein